jgi:hypothetical protein
MFRTLLLIALLRVGAAPVAEAQGAKPKPDKDEKAEKAEKPDVLVIDVDGQLQLTSASKFREFKKELERKHKQAVKDHTAAKRAARKNKEAFDDPKPKKPKVKVLSKKPLSQEKAEELMAQIEEERRKAEEERRKAKNKQK